MVLSPGEFTGIMDSMVSGSNEIDGITKEHLSISGQYGEIPLYTGEFWTAKQRDASSIHEVSYRACFKPQLPEFFIEKLTKKGDRVLDPFSGRGTTVIQAALMDRTVVSNDINPLSRILVEPRLDPPNQKELEERLSGIDLSNEAILEIDLSMFYHPRTLSQLTGLKEYLLDRRISGKDDRIDRWIAMVSTSRLTGHSPGFFSVYTLPPNQAVSRERQVKINRRLGQRPEFRDIKRLILKKSKSLFRNLEEGQLSSLRKTSDQALFLTGDAWDMADVTGSSVDLTVTSPPFLNIVQYSKDNWLRCWFNGLDEKEIEKRITQTPHLEEWEKEMMKVFKELYRVTRKGGWVAFEVGEIRKGSLNLEERIVPLGVDAGFECPAVVINRQNFTKTSNIWGVANNSSGTNSNRIILLRK